ncbi:hypothetical protein [Amycolatopsis sp. NPDC051903]|uniref:hypothetical protein n=1 Tax=Amycolatopsis sp. NPDC051903 TaxID=3363936 RepID=UPI0037BA57D1
MTEQVERTEVLPALAGRLATARGPLDGLRTAWLLLSALLIVAGLLTIAFIRPARDATRVEARLAAGRAPRSRWSEEVSARWTL